MNPPEIPSNDAETEEKQKIVGQVASSDVSEVYRDFLETEENQCDSFHLLYRTTESFRCLEQIMLSSSAFTRNKDFLFPPLRDPGINEAFNYIEPEPIYDDVGIEKYINLCKELHIVPISRIMMSLSGDKMNLKYYGLTHKQMQALTETLKINSHVENLNLQDNWFKRDDTEMIGNMLEENTAIKFLNLRECRIGEEGAMKLNEALSSSHFLTELDLSFNNLGDVGLMNLHMGLREAPSLRLLNLSHNNLTEECADTLEKILLENKVIQELDLSWNMFCTPPGNKKLFHAMKETDNLRMLNMAWNGISMKQAIAPITNYLKHTTNLEFLDISNNRLESESLKAVRTGILKNHSLKLVKIGNNIFTPDEALFLASVLPQKHHDPLQHLDMENVVFDKKVLPLLVKIKNAHKTIKFGNILGNYTIKGPDVNKLIFQRCKHLLEKPKKKKLKKDFGHFILAMPEEQISKEQFSSLLKKKKIKKLDQDLIKELCSRFAAKNQNVDCVEMKKTYMKYYPDTVLPPPPPKKKGKKGKKGKGKGKQKTGEQETPQENTAPVEIEAVKGDENVANCIIPKVDSQLVPEVVSVPTMNEGPASEAVDV